MGDPTLPPNTLLCVSETFHREIPRIFQVLLQPGRSRACAPAVSFREHVLFGNWDSVNIPEPCWSLICSNHATNGFLPSSVSIAMLSHRNIGASRISLLNQQGLMNSSSVDGHSVGLWFVCSALSRAQMQRAGQWIRCRSIPSRLDHGRVSDGLKYATSPLRTNELGIPDDEGFQLGVAMSTRLRPFSWPAPEALEWL